MKRVEKEKKSKNAERLVRYRKNMSPEQSENYKQKARVRMRKLREQEKKSPRVKTKDDIEKQRSQWKKYKHTYRSKLKGIPSEQKYCSDFGKTIRKLTPDQLLHCLEDNLTPTKKEFLVSKGAYVSPSNRKEVKLARTLSDELKRHVKMNGKNDYESNRKRLSVCHYLAKKHKQASYRRFLNVPVPSWRRMRNEDLKRKERKDVKIEYNKMAKEFFESVAVPIPGKCKRGRAVLPDTLANLHEQFTKINPNEKISLTRFRQQRPLEILTYKHAPLVGCVCEYCINIVYLVSVLNVCKFFPYRICAYIFTPPVIFTRKR